MELAGELGELAVELDEGSRSIGGGDDSTSRRRLDAAAPAGEVGHSGCVMGVHDFFGLPREPGEGGPGERGVIISSDSPTIDDCSEAREVAFCN